MNATEKINETHLAVLRKSLITGNLVSEQFPLNFAYQESIEELKIMSQNENRDAFELENFINRSELVNLKSSFNFCYYLGDAYQGMPAYTGIDPAVYEQEKQRHQAKIDDPKRINVKSISERELKDFVKRKREFVYQTFKRRQLAHALDVCYASMKLDQDVFAHSHRKIGYSYPEFHLSDDFTVGYYTNFGFGSASFFYTNITYKGIDIRPYSDWIRYRHANKIDIIRYTRRYYLENKYWNHALLFTAKTYNHSVNDSKTFVDSWIINECKEMVAGLEKILNSTKEFTLMNNFFQEGETVTLIDFDLIIFKGERISGALSFLDKLNELKEISHHIEGFIKRIVNCNLKVYHQMLGFISNYAGRLVKLNEEVQDYDQLILAVEERILLLQVDRKKIADDLYPGVELNITSNYNVEQRFIELFPILLVHRETIDNLNKKREELKNHIYTLSSTKTMLEGFCETIELHFKSMGDNSLAIA